MKSMTISAEILCIIATLFHFESEFYRKEDEPELAKEYMRLSDEMEKLLETPEAYEFTIQAKETL